MKFTGFLVKLTVDDRAEKVLQAAMRRMVFEAWGAWLDKFLEVVPVWSGESVGSVIKLASLIKKNVSISPAATAPGNFSRRGEAQGDAQLEESRGSVHIIFKTSVKHLIVNEFIDATIFGFRLKRPGPYKFTEQCKEAFVRSIRTQDGQLTNVFDFDLIGLG